MADEPRESLAPRPPDVTVAPRALEATAEPVRPSAGPTRSRSRAGAEEPPGRVKQVASAFVGGALLSMGLKRRSVGGMAMALAGGGLIYRGTRGRSLTEGMQGLRRRSLTGRGAREEGVVTGGTVLERSITIQKPGHELYRAWRLAENLSKVMGHFADVTTTGPDLQHWKVNAPFGRTFEWDSHVVEEQPGELLRWQSLKGAQFPNEGEVRFQPAPGDWGTVVTLRFRFSPPGGAVGDTAMKLLGDAPTMLAHKTLRRFKSLVETGEIPTTGPTPAAREGGHSSY